MGKQKKSTLSDVRQSSSKLNKQALHQTKGGFSDKNKPEAQPKKSGGFWPTKVPM